jgi:hypothetical protein
VGRLETICAQQQIKVDRNKDRGGIEWYDVGKLSALAYRYYYSGICLVKQKETTEHLCQSNIHLNVTFMIFLASPESSNRLVRSNVNILNSITEHSSKTMHGSLREFLVPSGAVISGQSAGAAFYLLILKILLIFLRSPVRSLR